MDRATAPLLGLLTHRRVGGQPVLPVVLSALELDDTRKPAPYRNGPRRFRFSVNGVFRKPLVNPVLQPYSGIKRMARMGQRVKKIYLAVRDAEEVAAPPPTALRDFTQPWLDLNDKSVLVTGGTGSFGKHSSRP